MGSEYKKYETDGTNGIDTESDGGLMDKLNGLKNGQTETVTVDASEARKIIEAVLFAAGYPVEYAKLSETLGLEMCQVRMLLDEMAEEYAKRGITLVLYENNCQFCSNEKYAPYVKSALGLYKGSTLSNSALEVLAVIAYHQPVTRAYIEQIRGVDSAYAINSLLDKDIIENMGKLDVPGRPNLYGTTANFLRLFGFKSISELPAADAFI